MSEIEVTFKGHYGSDLEHVNAARVSYGRESDWDFVDYGGGTVNVLKEKDKRLLQFLARGMTTDDWEKFVEEISSFGWDLQEHWGKIDKENFVARLWKWRDTPEHRSPFNHSFLSFHVRAPLFVARQLVKHEYLLWNEKSGRYIEFDEDSFWKPKEFRSKVRDKKQGSGESIEGVGESVLRDLFRFNSDDTFASYKAALDFGLCEEQARALLPLNLMTEWRWSGTFGAFAKMLRLRLAPDAQKETREVAKQIGEIIKPLFPVSYECLVERKF